MKKLLLLMVCPLLWLACKKESKEMSRSEQLRESTWRVTAFKVKFYDSVNSKDSVEDLYLSTPQCIKDNQLKFLDNYEGMELLLGQPCDTTELSDDKFEWELVNNETGLNFYNADRTFIKPNLRTDILRFQDGQLNLRYFEYPKTPDMIGDTVSFSLELTRN